MEYFKIDHIRTDYYVTLNANYLKDLDRHITEIEAQYKLYGFDSLENFFKYLIAMYSATIYMSNNDYHFRIIFRDKANAIEYCNELNKLYNAKMKASQE